LFSHTFISVDSKWLDGAILHQNCAKPRLVSQVLNTKDLGALAESTKQIRQQDAGATRKTRKIT
jgi:hypothetical protein